jgi:hypothetical protein
MKPSIDSALAKIAAPLRKSLLDEYKNLTVAYSMRDWRALGLSAGWFSEIIYTILLGLESNAFPKSAQKPKDMVSACKNLEQSKNLSRGLRILIPRLLPALYEIRNNRGIGHAGTDIDSNYMDARLTIAIAKWILAELVRELHIGDASSAQSLVDSIVEIPSSAVWVQGDKKRILVPGLSLEDKVLLLLVASDGKSVGINNLGSDIEVKNRIHFRKVLMKMHRARLIEFDRARSELTLLPPGEKKASILVAKFS